MSFKMEDAKKDRDNRQFHGGQEWRNIHNLVEDFSVTTNYLGLPASALEAASSALHHVNHYPPIDQEPAMTDMSKFLDIGDGKTEDNMHSRLILANGASEVIDLLIRMAPGKTWKTGPWDVQYMEYSRSAKMNNRVTVQNCEKTCADLICIVNPNNPSGDFLDVDANLSWIESNVTDGGFVLVDESMLPWHSANWLQHSLLSRKEKLKLLFCKRGVAVFVIHSWTKLWCCAGLRIGSVVCPTFELAQTVRNFMVPWSVNLPALAFLSASTKDKEYLHETWSLVSSYRCTMVNELENISKLFGRAWKAYGESWLSWIWLDVQDSATADILADAARLAGTPIRLGKHGYARPTFVRLRVFPPQVSKHLFAAFRSCLAKKFLLD